MCSWCSTPRTTGSLRARLFGFFIEPSRNHQRFPLVEMTPSKSEARHDAEHGKS